MKKILPHTIFFLFLTLVSFSLFSQKDSLLKAIKNCSVKDSADILNKLSIIYRFSDGDSALLYAEYALKVANKTNNVVEQGNAENSIGVQNHLKAKYDIATMHYLRAVKLFESIGFEKGIASASQNIGIVYSDQGNLELSKKYNLIAADLYKKNNHKKGLAAIYSNLATIYSEEKNISKTLEFHFLALKIREEIHDTDGIASSYHGLAIAFNDLKDYKKAIEYNEKCIAIYERFNNERSLATSYNNIGDSYFNMKNYNKAIECFLKGIDIAKHNEDYYALNDLYFNLALTYETNGNYKEALAIQREYDLAKDSLFKMESLDKVMEMESKYQNEKKELQLKNQELEIASIEKENRAKNIILLIGLIGLIGIAGFAFVAYRNFLKVKSANLIIKNQNEHLEIKNVEISQQKELIEVKQKEILDSITYAKRIQSAVLTGEDVWNKVSKEHFILFKPKDIVSGDFYWAYNTPNNRSIFVLADCTGHGVPGGFMSMLGNSFLNELIVDNKLFKANEILNKLRDKIITALKQEGHSEQKDGMDMSLCVWNKIDNTLEFAGANNPLWLLKSSTPIEGGSQSPDNYREGNVVLTEYKANKMPIGAYTEKLEPFTSHVIQLQKGDIVYLITDGFADQFGGPKGKKFKYRPLQDILIENYNKPMAEQKKALETALNQWKENYEQVDDISIIGVRV